MNHTRLKIIRFTLIMCYFLILSRFLYWQIIKSSSLKRQFSRLLIKPSVIQPFRGLIYDSLGFPLALNRPISIISLYKPDLTITPKDLLTAILSIGTTVQSSDYTQINDFFQNQSLKWITLKTQFPPTLPISLQKPGIIITPSSIRYYPETILFDSILGRFANHSGLESYYQKQLSGRSGYIWQSIDALNQPLVTNHRWEIPATSGLDLHLSINRYLQSQAAAAITQGVTKYQADSGSIIITNPSDNSILAMFSFSPIASESSPFSNPTISSLFEPGSIFKPIILALALETKSINTDYICTACSQPLAVNKYTITNWDNSLHPNSPLKDIIKYSDNIGMSNIIQKVGLNTFLNYYRLLGLNQKTNVDLAGEAKPVTKNYWSDIDLATASFGQGFAITQIKMIQLFNLLTHSSALSPPHLASVTPKKSSDEPIFGADTVRQVKEILKYATENGAVGKLKPPDIEVCGKSGTAQIAVKGGYTDSSTIASYIGFSPCTNPKFSMIVTINNPRSSPWGSSTAAPIWFDLARHLDILL